MMNLLNTINNLINPLRSVAHTFISPLWDLGARLYISYVFFKSGMTRYDAWANDNFGTQIWLFREEHPVPGLSPEFAAYSATIAELALPLLLTLGLFSRFAAAGILIMTAIIEFTYFHSNDHILWAFLAASIFIKGPGLISADHWIVKWLGNK